LFVPTRQLGKYRDMMSAQKGLKLFES